MDWSSVAAGDLRFWHAAVAEARQPAASIDSLLYAKSATILQGTGTNR